VRAGNNVIYFSYTAQEKRPGFQHLSHQIQLFIFASPLLMRNNEAYEIKYSSLGNNSICGQTSKTQLESIDTFDYFLEILNGL
jgi:hypothetical protein